ncbi:universal stress protein [Foliimonas ilicis]
MDLAVVGTHGRTRFAHALIGSIASQIINEVSCDVLVITSGRQQISGMLTLCRGSFLQHRTCPVTDVR